MTKLAFIHTTQATVEPLNGLAQEMLPEWGYINIVDDTILPYLAVHPGDLEEAQQRLVWYARFAEAGGAQVILYACPSSGEAYQSARRELAAPVLRVDEVALEYAAVNARRIGVLATNDAALSPALQLLFEKAPTNNGCLEVQPLLVEQAERLLSGGDQAGHDVLLLDSLTHLAGQVELVVLAQVSLERIVPALPADLHPRVLSPARLSLVKVRQVYQETYA